jgi:hypothetical protein
MSHTAGFLFAYSSDFARRVLREQANLPVDDDFSEMTPTNAGTGHHGRHGHHHHHATGTHPAPQQGQSQPTVAIVAVTARTVKGGAHQPHQQQQHTHAHFPEQTPLLPSQMLSQSTDEYDYDENSLSEHASVTNAKTGRTTLTTSTKLDKPTKANDNQATKNAPAAKKPLVVANLPITWRMVTKTAFLRKLTATKAGEHKLNILHGVLKHERTRHMLLVHKLRSEKTGNMVWQ